MLIGKDSDRQIQDKFLSWLKGRGNSVLISDLDSLRVKLGLQTIQTYRLESALKCMRKNNIIRLRKCSPNGPHAGKVRIWLRGYKEQPALKD